MTRKKNTTMPTVVLPSDIEALTRDVLEDGDDDGDASDSSIPELNLSDGAFDEETGTCSDHDGFKSDLHEDDDSDDSFPGTARVASHGSDESDMSIDEGEIGVESRSSIESSSDSESTRRNSG